MPSRRTLRLRKDGVTLSRKNSLKLTQEGGGVSTTLANNRVSTVLTGVISANITFDVQGIMYFTQGTSDTTQNTIYKSTQVNGIWGTPVLVSSATQIGLANINCLIVYGTNSVERLFVSSKNSPNVLGVDPSTGVAVVTLTAPQNIQAMARDINYVYCLFHTTPTVTGTTRHTIRMIRMSVDVDRPGTGGSYSSFTTTFLNTPSGRTIGCMTTFNNTHLIVASYFGTGTTNAGYYYSININAMTSVNAGASIAGAIATTNMPFLVFQGSRAIYIDISHGLKGLQYVASISSTPTNLVYAAANAIGTVTGPASSTPVTTTAVTFNNPTALAYNAFDGNVYVCDTGNSAIRCIWGPEAPIAPTLSLVSTSYVNMDGGNTLSVQFSPNGTIQKTPVTYNLIWASAPAGASVLNGITAENANRPYSLNMGTPVAGTTYTMTVTATNAAGTSPASSAISIVVPSTQPVIQSYLVTKIAGIPATSGSLDANISTFNGPSGSVCDPFGNMYICDSGNHRIRRMTPTGTVSTFAGSGVKSSTDGIGTAATFSTPWRITIDPTSSFLYVIDSTSHVIRMISIATQEVTTIAGKNNSSGYLNGVGTAAQFDFQSGGGDITVDATGNLYVADTNNNCIRKVTRSTGSTVTGSTGSTVTWTVTLLAGRGTATDINGTLLGSKFGFPQGLVLDNANNIYVADSGKHCIRFINMTTGMVSTLAGVWSDTGGAVDSRTGVATFNQPRSITFDSTKQNLYVADTNNHKIRVVTIGNGYVYTFAGGTTSGTTNGIAKGVALLTSPMGLSTDSQGNLYICQNTNHTIRKVSVVTKPTPIVFSTTQPYIGSTSGIISWTGGVSPGVTYTYNINGNTVAPTYSQTTIQPYTATFTMFSPNLSQAITVTAKSADNQTSVNNVIRVTSPGYVGTSTSFTRDRIDYFTTTLAGSGNAGSAEGKGFAASFNTPQGITVDINGNVYVADYTNNRIRMITQEGVVSTIAGSAASPATSVDGVGSAGTFKGPSAMVMDILGNIYVVETTGNKIRKLTPSWYPSATASGASAAVAPNTITWTVSTLAGSGTAGSADGAATAATFDKPYSICIDPTGTTLYVGCAASIRMITPINNPNVQPTVSSLADINAKLSPTVFNSVYGVQLDGLGNLLVAGGAYNTVFKYNLQTCEITPFVNNAKSEQPGGIAAVAATGTLMTPTVLDGIKAKLINPHTLTLDTSGNCIIVDTGNNSIRKVYPSGVVTTLAGAESGTNPSGITWRDGLTTTSVYNQPYALAVDPRPGNGSFYIADTVNNRIRVMTPMKLPTPITSLTTQYIDSTSALISWVGGTGIGVTYNYTINGGGVVVTLGSPAPVTSLAASTQYTIVITATNTIGSSKETITFTTPAAPTTTSFYVLSVAGNGSAGLNNTVNGTPQFNGCTGVARDGAGNIYVADQNNHIIRMVTPAGVVTNIAGNSSSRIPARKNGEGASATFDSPYALTVDTAGQNIYVSDGKNHCIRKITLSNGVWTVSTLAGSGTATPVGTASDGTGEAATFNSPRGLTMDTNGNLYVCDYGNHRIRKIVIATGVVTTIAGWSMGYGEGTGSMVRFNNPSGIVIDSYQNLYVTDTGNNLIRRISSSGVVSTLVGGVTLINTTSYTAPTGAFTDGIGTAVRFSAPSGIGITRDNVLFISDSNNQRIRRVTPSGVVTTVAGNGTAGNVNNTNTTSIAMNPANAQFNTPTGLIIDANNNIYLADSANHSIRVLNFVNLPTIPVFPTTTRTIPPSAVLTSQAVIVSEPTAITVSWTGGGTAQTGIKYTYASLGAWLPTKQESPVVFSGLTPDTTYSITVNCMNFTNTSGLTSTALSVKTAPTVPMVVSTYAGSLTNVAGSTDGQGNAATFNSPYAVAADIHNNVFVADYTTHCIRMISNTGLVTTIAGKPGTSGFTNGDGLTAATFKNPAGITVDLSGNVYVSDFNNHAIRKITPPSEGTTAWTVSTLAGSGTVTPAGTTMATADAVGTAATFNNPFGLHIDSDGFLYVADQNNHVIRTVNIVTGKVTTIAGTFLGAGNVVGPTYLTTKFNRPSDISIDRSTGVPIMYVADFNNSQVCVLTNNTVSVLQDNNTGRAVAWGVIHQSTSNHAPPIGSTATAAPTSLTSDQYGNLYVLENTTPRVRKITPMRAMTILAGSGTAGGTSATSIRANNSVLTATFSGPYGITINAGGSIFVADSGNNCIRMITSITPPVAPLPVSSAITSTSARITWPAVTDATSYSYTISPNIAGGPPVYQNVTSPLVLNRLISATPYTIVVSSVNSGGSSPSNPLRFTTLPPPPTPAVISAATPVPSSTSTSSSSIAWTGAQYATSYSFTLNGTAATPVSQMLTSAIFAGLTPGTSYTVIVTAINTSGTTPSTPFTFTSAPTQPVLTVTARTTTSVTLSWPSCGATSYTYKVNPSAKLTLPTVESSPFTLSGLAPGNIYLVTLTAINSAGSISTLPFQIITQNIASTTPPPNTVRTLYTGTTNPAFNSIQVSADNTTLYAIDCISNTNGELNKLNISSKTLTSMYKNTTPSVYTGSTTANQFMSGNGQVAADASGNIYVTSFWQWGGVYKIKPNGTIITIAGGRDPSFQNSITSGYSINNIYTPGTIFTGVNGTWPGPFAATKMISTNIAGTITLDQANNRYILTVIGMATNCAAYTLTGNPSTNGMATASTEAMDGSSATKMPRIYPGMAIGLALSPVTVGGIQYPAVPAFTPFVGSISGTTLTVTSVSSGSLTIGTPISMPNTPSNIAPGSTNPIIPVGTVISGFGPNTNGTIGTYTLSQSCTVAQTTPCIFGGYFTNFVAQVGKEAFVADKGTPHTASTITANASVTLIVSGITSGALSVGMWISGPGVCPGAYISAAGAISGTWTVLLPPYAANPASYGATSSTPGTIANPISLVGTLLAGTGYTPANSTIPSLVVGAATQTVTSNQCTWSVIITDFLTGTGDVGTYVVSNVRPGTSLYGYSPTSSITIANVSTMNVFGLGTTPFSTPVALTCAGFTGGNMIGFGPNIGNAVSIPYGLCVDPTGTNVYVIENQGNQATWQSSLPQTMRKFVKMPGTNPNDEIWKGFVLAVRDAYTVSSPLQFIPGNPLKPAENASVLQSSSALWAQGPPNPYNLFLYNSRTAVNPPTLATGTTITFANAPSWPTNITPPNTLLVEIGGNVTNLYAFSGGHNNARTMLSLDPSNPSTLYIYEPVNGRLLRMKESATSTAVTINIFAGDIARAQRSVYRPSINQTADADAPGISSGTTAGLWYDGSGAIATFARMPVFGNQSSQGSLICTDKNGNVYIADNLNRCIRMITPLGIVSTVAGGNGNPSLLGTTSLPTDTIGTMVPQSGTNAGFFNICSITVDSNRILYVSELAFDTKYRLRSISPFVEYQLNPPTIPLTIPPTISPTRSSPSSSITDNYLIQTIVNYTTTLTYGTATVPIAPVLNALTIDSKGNLYFTHSQGGTTTGQACNLYMISAASLASSSLTTNPTVTLIAGTSANNSTDAAKGTALYSNGTATNCTLDTIIDTLTDNNGNIYLMNTRQTDLLASNTVLPIGMGSIRKLIPTSTNNTAYNLTNIITWPLVGYTGITVNSAGQLLALVCAKDNTSLRMADSVNPYDTGIYQIPLDGSMLTSENMMAIVGSFPAVNTRFINSLVCDTNTNVLYIATLKNIYKLVPGVDANKKANYTSSALTQSFENIAGFDIDKSGNIYIADSSPIDGKPGTITVINPSGRQLAKLQLAVATNQSTISPTEGLGGIVGSIMDLNIDNIGNIIVVDRFNVSSVNRYCFRRISFISYVTNTYAGSGYGFLNTSLPTTSQFKNPTGITFDSAKNAYIVDSENHCIRRITPAGVVSTFAGNPGVAGYADGTGTTALFNSPYAICIDKSGILYVTDTMNHCIRMISSNGVVSTFAGQPDGAYFSSPTGCSIAGTTLTLKSIDAVEAVGLSASDWKYGIPLPGMSVFGPGVTAGTTIVSGPTYVASPASVQYTVNISQTTTSTTGFTFVASKPTPGYINGSWNATISSITTHTKTYTNAAGAHPGVKFNMPMGITCDYQYNKRNTAVAGAAASGNTSATDMLYIADTGNNCIRSIKLSAQASGTYTNVRTVAGPDPSTTLAYYTKNAPFSPVFSRVGAAGPANPSATSTAEFSSPTDVAASWYAVGSDLAVIIYVTDTNNSCLRSIVCSNNIVQTGGTANGTTSTHIVWGSQGNPSKRLDSNTTLPSYITPISVEVDNNGNIYFADKNTHSIYSLNIKNVSNPSANNPVGVLTFIGGNPAGTPGYTDGDRSSFFNPHCISSASPDTGAPPMYIADSGNNRIRSIRINPASNLTLIQQGQQSTRQLYFPATTNGIPDSSLAPGINKFYDVSNNTYVYTTGGSAGAITQSPSITLSTPVVDRVVAATKAAAELVAKQASGAAAQASAAQASAAQQRPSSAQRGGNVSGSSGAQTQTQTQTQPYGNITSTTLTPSTNLSITTIAGKLYEGMMDGTNPQGNFPITFRTPQGITVTSSGIAYITDTSNNLLRKLVPGGASATTKWTVSTVPGLTQLNRPKGVTADSTGNLYIADTGNNCIRRYTTAGVLTTYAGVVQTVGGFKDGPAATARFNSPTDVAVDTSGNVYVVDSLNNSIRLIDTKQNVTTLAGSSTQAPGNTDGESYYVGFNRPYGIAIDSKNNLYVTDSGNNCVRTIIPENGGTRVITVAGDLSGGQAGVQDGFGSSARFSNPKGITIYGTTVYICDGTGVIRALTPAIFSAYPTMMMVTTVAGNGYPLKTTDNTAPLDGVGVLSGFNQPSALGVDGSGNLFIVDSLNNSIRYGTPTNMKLYRVSSDKSMPVDVNGNQIYTKVFESTLRKYIFIHNTTGVELASYPNPPIVANGTSLNITYNDYAASSYPSSPPTASTPITPTNVWTAYTVTSDATPGAPTLGMTFYYSPTTRECVWDLPSSAMPRYPPTGAPIADPALPDTCLVVKYLDPVSGNNYYLNLITTEISWNPPTVCKPLVPYPVGQTLYTYRTASAAAVRESAAQQLRASSALQQQASAAVASSAIQQQASSALKQQASAAAASSAVQLQASAAIYHEASSAQQQASAASYREASSAQQQASAAAYQQASSAQQVASSAQQQEASQAMQVASSAQQQQASSARQQEASSALQEAYIADQKASAAKQQASAAESSSAIQTASASLQDASAAQQKASSAQQQIASSAVQQAASSAVQQAASSAVQQAASAATASSAVQQAASAAAVQQQASAAAASSAVQQAASAAVASSAVQQAASAAVASSAVQQEASSAVQLQASAATASSAVQQAASAATASSAVQQAASAATASSAVQQAASAAVASSAVQLQASSAQQQEASAAVASSAVQLQASSAQQQQASSAQQQQASSARQQEASSALQEASAADQKASSALQQASAAESSSAIQTASASLQDASAAQEKASSAQQQIASSAVQQQASSAVQQQASSAQQQASAATASSAVQLQASSAVQQKASSAQASAAQVGYVAALGSTSVTTSSTAAVNLGNTVTSQVQYLLATGSNTAAVALITQTLQQIRASAAFKAGDPETLAMVAALVILNQQAVSSNPGAQASAAQASAAQGASIAALRSTSVATSSSAAVELGNIVTAQVQYLLAAGSNTAAAAILTQTLQQLRASSAFLAGDPATLAAVAALVTLNQQAVTSTPGINASAAQASAAQVSYVAALGSTDVQISSTAAINLETTVTTQVEYLLATGSNTAAIALLTQTLQQLRASSAFLAGDPATLAAVAALVTLNQQAVSSNPTASASAAQESSARVASITALRSTSVTSSSTAAVSLGNAVSSQVEYLLSIGSNAAAAALLTQTLQQLRSSTAFKAGDPATLAAVAALVTLSQQAVTSTPGAAASAAQASAAQASYVAGLTNSSVTTSSSAAVGLGNAVTAQVEYLLATGSNAAAVALLTQTLQQLRASSAYLAGDKATLDMVAALVALNQEAVSSNPGAQASAAQASAAQGASIAALRSTSVATSSTAALSLGNSVNSQVQYLLAGGSNAAAQALLTQTLQQLRASTAFKAGDPDTLAMVTALVRLNQQVISTTPGSTASAAQASAAQGANVIALGSTDILTSSKAAKDLGDMVTSQVQYLFSTGSYSASAALLTQTLQQLRASTAFKSSDPATLAMVAALVALNQEAVSSNPGTTASAAQASAAQVSYVAALKNSSVSTSSTAAVNLGNTVTAQVQYLLATGSNAAATAILTQTLRQLRSSTAFLAGDPDTVAMVEALVALDQLAIISNSGTQASSAKASALGAADIASLNSTTVSVSSTAAINLGKIVTDKVDYLLAIGSNAAASALLLQTLQQLRASSAFKAGDKATLDMVAALVALQEEAMTTTPGASASAAQASAAQSSYVAALGSSSVTTSSSAAVNLGNTVNAQAQYLLARGSNAAAQALLTQTLQQIRASAAFLAGDKATLEMVAALVALNQQAVSSNPGAQASAAQASAAQVANIAALGNSSVTTSSTAAVSLGNSVTAQVEYLLATGSNTAAQALLTQTLQQLRASTAFLAGDPETVAMVAALVTLNQQAVSSTPGATASAAQASAAQGANVAALRSTSVTTSSTAAVSLGGIVTAQVQYLLAVGSSAAAVALVRQTLQQLRASTAFLAGDPETVAMVAALVTLTQQAMAFTPGVNASSAQASAAQAANVAALSNSSVTTSSAAAVSLGNTVKSQVEYLLTIGSNSAAVAMIGQTLQQLRDSTAFKADDPDTVAMVTALVALYQQAVSSTPGATASAASLSTAQAANVAALSNSSVTTSSTAAVSLGKTVTAQVQQLLTVGSSSTAVALVSQTLQQLRESTAFKAGDPETVAMVTALVALYQQAVSSTPGATASSAQASAAQAANVAALSNSSITTSSTAAVSLGGIVTTQVQYLLTTGSSSAAVALVSQTLQQLRDSTAFKAGDPETVAMVAALVALYQQAVSSTPGSTASAAQASAAQAANVAALGNTDVKASSTAAVSLGGIVTTQVQQLLTVGSSSAAVALVSQTLQQLRDSTAFKAGDPETVAMVTALVALYQQAVSSNPGATASAARASAAQAANVAALSDSSVITSSTAAVSLGTSVTTQVQYLLTTGSSSAAVALVSQTLQQLRDSTAFKAGDPETVAMVTALVTLYQQAVSSTPGATASAAQASAAQAANVAALGNTDVKASSTAALSLGTSVTTQVQQLLTVGSSSAAVALVSQTLQQLRDSTAFKAGDPETVAMVNALVTLYQQAVSSTPGATASAAQASAAQAANVAALGNTDVKTSSTAAVSLGTSVTTQVQYLLTTGSSSAAVAIVSQTLQQLRDSTAFKAGDPETVAMVTALVALYQQAVSSSPGATASAAQASAAQAANVAALENSSVETSSAAATSLGNIITNKLQYLLSSGSYSDAQSLAQQTLKDLRNSTAFKAGDPATVAMVASLLSLEQTAASMNPTTQASAAQASAAIAADIAALKSTDLPTSLAAAKNLTSTILSQTQSLINLGSHSSALTLISETIQSITASPGYAARNPEIMALLASLTAMSQTIINANPPSQASAAQASAAQAYYMSNLQNPDVQASVTAALNLGNSIISTINMLIAMGAYQQASTLLAEITKVLKTSSAYTSGNPEVLSMINVLTSMANTIGTILAPSAVAPAPTASAPTASAPTASAPTASAPTAAYGESRYGEKPGYGELATSYGGGTRSKRNKSKKAKRGNKV